jgi:glyoxylase-like metal-dependent hydrolase (beta-lactamase superfamily II)
MIADAFTTNTLAGTGFIAAVARCQVFFFSAFHGYLSSIISLFQLLSKTTQFIKSSNSIIPFTTLLKVRIMASVFNYRSFRVDTGMMKRIAKLSNKRSLYLYRGNASNMYILTDSESRATYLVDCGMPSDAGGLVQTLATLPPLKRVVCTHFHVDHISAWPALKNHFRDCNIWFHENAKPLIDGKSSVAMPGLKDIRGILLPCMKEYRYFPKIKELFRGALLGTPFKKGFPEDRVRFFSDDQEMLPGFISIHTPGHVPDEVSFFEPHSGQFISGDFIIVLNNRITVNTFLTDKNDQLNSMERIKQRTGITAICPGHGKCRSFSINDITK